MRTDRAIAVMFIFLMLGGTAMAESGKMRVNIKPHPPALSVEVAFSEPSGNNLLDAEETGTLKITVQNRGRGDAFDVTALLTAEKTVDGLSFPKEVPLGTIPAGGSVTRTAEFQGRDDLATGQVRIRIEFREANRLEPDPVSVSFGTRVLEPPEIIVADIGISDANGNSKVEPGELVEVTARIQNVGRGDARGVTAEVEFGKNVFNGGDGPTRFDLGNLSSGAHKDINFSFYANKAIPNGERIPISLRLSEARPRFRVARALDMRMNAPQRKAQELVVRGEDRPALSDGKIVMAGGLSVDVDVDIPEGEKAGPSDVAVVIGNRNYTVAGIPQVEFADRDAAMMREYLLRTFGFREENIIYERDATLSRFNEIFGTETAPEGKLHNYVQRGVSRVFIYYAGHGAPDLKTQEAYFVPVDANPQYIASNGYRIRTFFENLARVPAKSFTIVLDSCFSGNSGKGMILKDISPAMVKVRSDYAAPKNALLLTSAAFDQVSTWYPEKRHSLYTYYFLKGVRGGADANGDGTVTAGELKAYLSENVPYMSRRLAGLEQNPVVTGDESQVVVRLRRTK